MLTSPFESTPMARPCGVAFLILALATAIPGVVTAQTATLKGKVIDSELGEPIPGAIVKIKGGSPITADTAGHFSISSFGSRSFSSLVYGRGTSTIHAARSTGVSGASPM